MRALPAVEWLTVTEASRFFHVTRRTIFNWIDEGRVQVEKTPGGHTRIAVDRAQWIERKAS